MVLYRLCANGVARETRQHRKCTHHWSCFGWAASDCAYESCLAQHKDIIGYIVCPFDFAVCQVSFKPIKYHLKFEGNVGAHNHIAGVVYLRTPHPLRCVGSAITQYLWRHLVVAGEELIA